MPPSQDYRDGEEAAADAFATFFETVGNLSVNQAFKSSPQAFIKKHEAIIRRAFRAERERAVMADRKKRGVADGR